MLNKKTSIIMFSLLLGASSFAQNRRSPRTLSEDSKNALEKAQNTAAKNNNDRARTAVGQVITIASGVENNELGEPTDNPVEILAKLPERQREEINVIVDEQLGKPEVINSPDDNQFWTIFKDIINRPNATVCTGSSHGDPHFRTYDGHKYDLMSVGEFVMTRSTSGHFEVQTRQKSSSPGVSMNSAVAMYVNGDTVCIYAQDGPANSAYPIRINGKTLDAKTKFGQNLLKFSARQLGVPHSKTPKKTINLPRGGQLSLGESVFWVKWPTGETVTVKLFGNAPRQFMNVTPVVYANQQGAIYEGLMGNANGNPDDDLMLDNESDSLRAVAEFYNAQDVLKKKGVKNSVRKAQRNYNKQLALEFGESWRVKDGQSLFGDFVGSNLVMYGNGVFQNDFGGLADLNKDEVRKAKKVCEGAGVRDDLLDGCITDVARTGNVDFAESAGAVEVPDVLVKELGFSNKLEPIAKREYSPEKIKLISKEINRETAKVNRQNTLGSISKGIAESNAISTKPMAGGSKGRGNSNSKGNTTQASGSKTNSKTQSGSGNSSGSKTSAPAQKSTTKRN